MTRKEEKGQTFSAEKFPSDVKPDRNIKTTKQRKVESLKENDQICVKKAAGALSFNEWLINDRRRQAMK